MPEEVPQETRRRMEYHMPTPNQVPILEENRERFMTLDAYLVGLGETRETTHARDILQAALMWTNAHVICNGVT
jgi:hypothetical protein